MTRTLVMGDSHGAAKAIKQCLDRCNFDYENDRLIHLGDVSDGWPETYESVELLMKINNFDLLDANHDHWTERWMTNKFTHEAHKTQGGKATLRSYKNGRREGLERHLEFFRSAKPYILENSRLFVHAGIDVLDPIEDQTRDTLRWDRLLTRRAWLYKDRVKRVSRYDEVFVGHTATNLFIENHFEPLHLCEVWMLDTGAGWDGRLTIMDADTKEYWQSDLVPSLYPNVVGRR